MRECERDSRVVGITAAMNSGTGLNILQKAMPERYFDVGIAEQQAILFASGLALEGVKPVAAIYSTFLQRAYDQIVHDVCLQNLNVVFAMDRAGLVGDDGPTHHGVFDIAYLRCLPQHRADGPARRGDAGAHAAHRARPTTSGPIALRYPRGEGTGVAIPSESHSIPIGTGEILIEAEASEASAQAGRRVALIGYGSGVGKALEAAAQLKGHELAVTVADARFAKPIDAGLMAQLAAEHDLLVTVEEGVLAGGFGSAVWETLNETGAARTNSARGSTRPLCHAWQARAAARGGRFHRQAHRRARPRGHRRAPVGHPQRLSPQAVPIGACANRPVRTCADRDHAACGMVFSVRGLGRA